MKLVVLLPVLAILFGLWLASRRTRFRMNMLGWVIAWVVAVYVILDFGFVTPVPKSVIGLYMGILALALLTYVTSDPARMRQFTGPLTSFMTEKRFTPYLATAVILVPALVAANIYFAMTQPPAAPAFGRTVHPAPPDQIMVHENPISLINLHNPFRHLEDDDPAAFERHVERGREIYYENCFYCHGDLMAGDGMFAHALNPIPTSFQDAGTISQLQEGFLFWRIAKGGPGLPAEGGPWDSAMPAWEKFLTEEEMWEVVLFLYDFTGWRPRAVHAEEAAATGE